LSVAVPVGRATIDATPILPMMTMMNRTLPALIAATLFFAAIGSAVACPNCKETVAQADGQIVASAGNDNGPSGANMPRSDMARGFNYSVLLMLAVPYTMVGVGGFSIYWLLRKSSAANRAAVS